MKSKVVFASLLVSLASCVAVAQDAPAEMAEMKIDGRAVTVTIAAGSKTAIIPNLHAPMRTIKWAAGSSGDKKLEVVPLVDKWRIKVTNSADTDRQVRLMLAAKPLVTAELTPIKWRADRGYDLPAHMGRVVSDKLRYELQPWKNTIGYWADVDDYAYFVIHCGHIKKTESMKWNVGILQGCGAGQGGSDMTISLHGPIADDSTFDKDQAPVTGDAVSQLEFKAEETGHFQNFKWRHVGELSTSTTGIYVIKVAAKKIAKNAAMDFRAVSLTPIP